MIFERSLLAVLATVAFGVAAASAAVPAVEPLEETIAVAASSDAFLLASADDDLTWYTVTRNRRDPFDPSGPADWVTRGDPGSQDSSFNSVNNESLSNQQDEDDHHNDNPPCLC